MLAKVGVVCLTLDGVALSDGHNGSGSDRIFNIAVQGVCQLNNTKVNTCVRDFKTVQAKYQTFDTKPPVLMEVFIGVFMIVEDTERTQFIRFKLQPFSSRQAYMETTKAVHKFEHLVFLRFAWRLGKVMDVASAPAMVNLYGNESAFKGKHMEMDKHFNLTVNVNIETRSYEQLYIKHFISACIGMYVCFISACINISAYIGKAIVCLIANIGKLIFFVNKMF